MKNAKRIAVDAMLVAIGLLLFIIEMQIPPLTAIPGIKIGLANVVTLFAVYYCGKRDAAAVLFGRIVLGAVFSGNASTFLYSAAGGLLCYIVMCLLSLAFSRNIWPVSVFGAISHNAGQIITAAVLMHTTAVFWYIPYLLLSAILAGTFTGLCAQFVFRRLSKGKEADL